MTSTTLWDRQRSAAREEITRTALRLFLAHGFEQTTIDQIVTEVGVSRRSFFRYFGTKEDIVLGDLAARGEAIAAAVAARPADEGPWDALLAGMEASAEATMPDPAADLALGRMLFDTPSLRARHIEKRLRWQQLLVPLVAERVDGDSARLHASAIVASALACLDAVSEVWIAQDGRSDLADLYREAIAAVRS